MSDDTTSSHPLKHAVAVGIPALGASMVAGSYAYNHEANRVLDELVVAGIDSKAFAALNKENRALANDVRDVFTNDKFLKRREALHKTMPYESIRSSQRGIDHLSHPELVDEILFHRHKNGYDIAEVKLNDLALHGITAKDAATVGLSNAKFDAAGNAIEGSYLIHYLPDSPPIGMMEITGERAIPSSQIMEVAQHTEWKNWVKEAEKQVERATEYVDHMHIRHYSEMFRESATTKQLLVHIPTSSKWLVIGSAIAGFSVVAALMDGMIGANHRQAVANREQETALLESMQTRSW